MDTKAEPFICGKRAAFPLEFHGNKIFGSWVTTVVYVRQFQGYAYLRGNHDINP